MKILKIRILKLYVGLLFAGALFMLENVGGCSFSKNIVKAMESGDMGYIANGNKKKSVADDLKNCIVKARVRKMYYNNNGKIRIYPVEKSFCANFCVLEKTKDGLGLLSDDLLTQTESSLKLSDFFNIFKKENFEKNFMESLFKSKREQRQRHSLKDILSIIKSGLKKGCKYLSRFLDGICSKSSFINAYDFFLDRVFLCDTFMYEVLAFKDEVNNDNSLKERVEAEFKKLTSNSKELINFDFCDLIYKYLECAVMRFTAALKYIERKFFGMENNLYFPHSEATAIKNINDAIWRYFYNMEGCYYYLNDRIVKYAAGADLGGLGKYCGAVRDYYSSLINSGLDTERAKVYGEYYNNLLAVCEQIRLADESFYEKFDNLKILLGESVSPLGIEEITPDRLHKSLSDFSFEYVFKKSEADVKNELCSSDEFREEGTVLFNRIKCFYNIFCSILYVRTFEGIIGSLQKYFDDIERDYQDFCKEVKDKNKPKTIHIDYNDNGVGFDIYWGKKDYKDYKESFATPFLEYLEYLSKPGLVSQKESFVETLSDKFKSLLFPFALDESIDSEYVSCWQKKIEDAVDCCDANKGSYKFNLHEGVGGLLHTILSKMKSLYDKAVVNFKSKNKNSNNYLNLIDNISKNAEEIRKSLGESLFSKRLVNSVNESCKKVSLPEQNYDSTMLLVGKERFEEFLSYMLGLVNCADVLTNKKGSESKKGELEKEEPEKEEPEKKEPEKEEPEKKEPEKEEPEKEEPEKKEPEKEELEKKN